MADEQLINVPASLGRDLENAGRGLDELAGGFRNLSREMYRYTFYAMAALRVGAALLQGALIRGLVRSATAGQDALDRLAAISAEASEQIRELSATANEIAMRTPHDFASIVQGMEMLYRAGLSLEDVQSSISSVARLATISGRSIATEADFLATILLSFGDTLGAGGAAAAVDQLARASTMSSYWFGQLQRALSNCMATASALNQDLSSTLAILVAFSRKGIGAAQAGTLLNRTLAQMGNPKVIEFFEEVLQSYSMLGLGTPPPLFTAEGLGDVGAAMVAMSEAANKVLDDLRRYAPEILPEAQKDLLIALSEVFGVRGLRGILALSKITFQGPNGETLEGLEAYNAMLEQIRKASEGLGASQEYLERLYGTWQYSRSFLGNMADAVKRNLGTPLIQALNPVVRLLGEAVGALAAFGSTAKGVGRDVMQFASTMLSVGGTITVVTGAIALAWGLLRMWSGRLWDVGSSVQRALIAKQITAASIAGGKFSAEALLKMPAHKVGLAWMFGSALGPLSMIAKIVMVVGAGFLIWKANLGGVQKRLAPITDYIKGIMAELPGTSGSSWGERLSGWLSPSQSRTGSFLGGVIQGMKRTLDFFIRAFFVFFDFVKWVADRVFWAYRTFISPVITAAAWVAGKGDVKRGWENLGKLFGVLFTLSAIGWIGGGTSRIIHGGIIKLVGFIGGARKLFTQIVGLVPFFRTVGRGLENLGLAIVIRSGTWFFEQIGGALVAAGQAIQRFSFFVFVKRVVGGFVGRFLRILLSPLTMLGKTLLSDLIHLFATRFIKWGVDVAVHFRVLLSPVILLSRALWSLAVSTIPLVIRSLCALAAAAWASAGSKIASTVGGIAKTIGTGIGGFLAAKGFTATGALISAHPIGAAATLLAALLSAVGYGIYKLVSGKSGAKTGASSTLPTSTISRPVTVALPIQQAPVASNVSFAPTIILKEGTPKEHAEQILSIMRAEVPQMFREETNALAVYNAEYQARSS